jgi:hypothetical protein
VFAQRGDLSMWQCPSGYRRLGGRGNAKRGIRKNQSIAAKNICVFTPRLGDSLCANMTETRSLTGSLSFSEELHATIPALFQDPPGLF